MRIAMLRLRLAFAVALSLACHTSIASAQTFTWNATSSGTGPVDGSGTWNASNTNWWNGTGNQAWSAGNIAWFGNGGGAGSSAGTVTVTGSLNAGGITFGTTATTARYTLTSGTIGLTSGASILLSGSASAPLNNTSNAAAPSTINSRLIAENLTISRRSGETNNVGLTLGGSNSLTGTLTIGNAAFLSVSSANSLGSADVNVNTGGALSINANGTYANNFLISGTGPVGSNYAPLRFASGVAAPTVLTGTVTFGGGDIGIGGQGTITGQNSNVVIANALTGTVGTLSFIQTGSIQLLAKTAYTTTSGTIFRQTGSLVLDAGNETLPAGTVLTFPNNSATKLVLGGTSNGAMTQTVKIGSQGYASTSFVGGASGTSTLIVQDASGLVAFAGTLGGAGTNENNIGLTIDVGGSTVYLSGTSSTYTGPTQILSGKLALGASNNGVGGRLSPSTTVAISSGATLWFNNVSGTYGGAVANSLSGAGGVQLASGTLTLSGSNSYSGGTVLQPSGSPGSGGSAGVLVLGDSNALGSSTSPLTISGSGGVDLGGYSISQGAVSVTVGAGMGVPTIGNGTLTASSFAVSNASGTARFTANLISEGGLTKTGAGVLAISGSNSLTGTTAINAGTVQLGNAFALGGGGDIGFGGGTLQFSGSGTPDVAAQVKNSASAMSFDTNGESVTFTSPLGASNTAGLTKLGSGTLTLTGNNAYAGTTTISGGVLRFADSVTGISSGTVSIANTAGATLDINGATQSIAALTGGGSNGGSVILNGGTLAVGSANTSTTYSGNFAGTPGTLTKQGRGTLTLNGTSSALSGISLQGGLLVVSPTSTSTFALGTIARSVGAGLSLQSGSGTITVDAGTTVTNGMIGPWAITGTGANLTYATQSSGTVVAFTPTGTAATSASLPNSATANFVLQSTTGTAPSTVLANTIRYTGTAGTTTLQTNGSFTVNGLINASSSGNWQLGTTGTLTMGSSELVLATNNTSFVLNGVAIRETVAGSNLTLISTGGNFTLSGAVGFTGDINYASTSAQPQLSMTSTGTLNNINLPTGGPTSFTLTTTGTFQVNGGIAGVGATLTKVGAGTLRILGNSSYTGTTTISAGTLEAASLANVGTASSLGTPTAASGTIGIANGATLRYIGAAASTTNRVLNLSTAGSGTVSLDASGSGPLTFTSNLSFSGSGAKTLSFSGSSTADNTFAGTIGDVNFAQSQFTSITKTGAGRWVLAGTNSYFGSTSIDQGELVLGTSANASGNGALGSNTAAQITIGSAAGTGTAALLLDTGVDVAYRAFTIPVGSQATIIGAAAGTGTASFTSANASLVTFGRDFTLQAATGGTLVMNNLWTQASGTSVNVRVGSVNNEGTVVLGQALPASGLVRIDRGTLRLGTSGTTAGSLAAAAGIVVGPAGSLNPILDVQSLVGAFTVGAAQTLSGTGTLRLDGDGVTMAGTFRPGNSPGIFTYDGAGMTTLSGTTILELSGGGTTAGVDFDQVRFTGGGTLNYGGGTLNLEFGSTYADNSVFPLFSFATTASGSVASITASGSYGLLNFIRGPSGVWTSGPTSVPNQTMTFTESTGVLVVVPEPATLALAAVGIGLAGWAAARRRRK